MIWRVARSLLHLREQVNAKYPGRSKASDGTIGNAEHAARSSDHNPYIKDGNVGVVRALDLTHDPAHGLDSEHLAQALVASRDPRIRYIISNKKICSGAGGPNPWKWRPYTGANPHNHHCHISVLEDKPHYDSVQDWDLSGVAAPREDAPPASAHPTLRRSSTGVAVKELQTLLGLVADGRFGPETETAVKAKQKAAHIVADGVVGPQTWDALT